MTDGWLLGNGPIWTGDRDVEALGIAGDRILAAGTEEEARAAIGADARFVDLGGHRVIPGLIDSHVHFLRAGMHWNDVVRWDDVETLQQGLSRIAQMASETPEGTWIRVLGGWHPHRFVEGRGPTRSELDAAAPDHPVYVQLLYEEAVLNSLAIAAALGKADPSGGTIDRDGSGAPTGIIRGPGAFASVLASIPQPSVEKQRASFQALMAECTRLGLTGVVDPGGFGVSPVSYHGLLDVWKSGDLDLRVRLYVVPWERGSEVAQIRSWVEDIEPGTGDDWLRYVGVGEIFTFDAHDMEGLNPFTVGAEARADLVEITTLLARSGWPGHLHAILDPTIDAVLDVWEQVASEEGALPRFSLTHADFISERNLKRARDLGIGIGTQSRFLFRAADGAASWGASVVAGAPPLRDILDLSIPLGAGTDGTVVTPINPWLTIWWLVTGNSLDGAPPRDARHRLTRVEGLAAYTSGSAWFSLEERTRGRLAPGMLADLVVLSDDYFAMDDDRIPDLTSLLTMIGGRIVHAKGSFTRFIA